MRNRFVVLVAVLGLLAFACGGDDDAEEPSAGQVEETSMDMDDHEDEEGDMGMDADHVFAFGEPADAAGADREIEVLAGDDFSYEPPAIEVSQGEVITFIVTNDGKIVHEFVIGDEEFQDEHEAEMADMEGEMMHDEANAIALEPGETKEFTWRFTEMGEFLYACHEPGHYDAGMIGTIRVQ